MGVICTHTISATAVLHPPLSIIRRPQFTCVLYLTELQFFLTKFMKAPNPIPKYKAPEKYLLLKFAQTICAESIKSCDFSKVALKLPLQL